MFTSKSMRIGLDDTFYLEDVIEGYTTIDVTGRESIERTVSSDEVGVRDGSIYKYKKYGTRTLTVSFVIEGADSTELLSKLDELNSYLDEEEKEFIFDDEPDKFYRGTVDGQPEISIATPGGSDFGVATGSFNILCSDPFKYAVEETIIPFDVTEANASSTAIVEYSGTRPAYPTYEAFMFSKKNVWDMDTDDGTADIYYEDSNAVVETVDSDTDVSASDIENANTSYISFFDKDGHILQFGDPGADIDNSYQQCDGSLEYDADYVYYTATLNDDGVYKFETASITKEEYNLDPASYYLKLEPDQTLTDKSFKSTSGVSLDSTVWKINALNANGINLPDHRDNQSPSMSSQYYKSSNSITYSSDSKYIQSNLLTSSKYKAGRAVSKYPTLQYNLKVVVVSRDRTSVKLRFTVSCYKGKGAITKKNKIAITASILNSAGETLKTKAIKSASTAYSKAAKTLSAVTFADFSISGLEPTTQSLSLKFAVSGTKNVGSLAATTFKISIPTYATPAENSYFYGPSVGTYGIPATNETSVWHGPSLLNILPADNTGARGAKRFNMSYHINMRTTDTADLAKKQHGQFVCYLIGGSGVSSGVIQNPEILSAMSITKTSDSNTNGTIAAQVRTSETVLTPVAGTGTIDLQYSDVFYTPSGSSTKKTRNNYNIPCSVTKTDTALKFVVDNVTITYTIKDTSYLRDAKVYGVAFGFYQRWTDPAFSWLGIRDFKFTKSYCDTKVKTVNPFGISDILTVNTGSGDVLLNGVDSQALGALGNDWEKMVLTPGINQYNAYCSMNDKAAIPKVRRRCRGYAYIRCEEDKYESDEQYYILGSTYTPARGHDRVTESSEGYSLPIPSGAQSVSVLNVGGKSVVKNQLMHRGGPSRTVEGVTFTNNGDGTWTINGTSTGTAYNAFSIPVIVGHKYYHRSLTTQGSADTYKSYCVVNVSPASYDYGSGVIETATGTGDTNFVIAFVNNGVTVNNIKLVPQYVDLTTWFGAGNEPTTTSDPRMQQVYDYLATNPSYNPGEVVSADVESVDVKKENLVNFAQWDISRAFTKEGDYYKGGVGEQYVNSSSYYKISKMKPNTQYVFNATVRIPSNSNATSLRLKFEYTDGTYTQSVWCTTDEWTPLSLVSADGKTVLSCYVEYSNGGIFDIKTDMELFEANTVNIAIPSAVQALDGYGWSAGSVYNEVDYANKKYIKRVGSVDLGSLSWSLNGANQDRDSSHFFAYIDGKKYGDAEIICAKFESSDNHGIDYPWTYTQRDINNGFECYVPLSSYPQTTSGKAQFINLVSGTYLYYELATPIVTDISDLLDDGFLENISVEEGGTITFKQSELHLPVPSTEEYAKELAPGTLTMSEFLSNPEMFYRLVSGTYIPCSYSDWDESATYYVSSGTPITPVSITEEQYNAAYDMYFYKDIIDEYDPNRNYYLEGSTTPTPITQNAYEANPTNYFFYDEALPQFRLRFREVYV